MKLDPNEALTVYKAIEIAHMALAMGLQDPQVTAGFPPCELAQNEELCLKFADLLERFKGYVE